MSSDGASIREALLTELLGALGDRWPEASELRPWLERLPARDREPFLSQLALILGMREATPQPRGEIATETTPGPRPLLPLHDEPRAIDHYEVLGVISRRPGSTVFRAHDRLLGRDVAIKLLPPCADERARERFGREARLLAELEDPDIVRILDAGFVDERPWIVLELIDGPDLAHVVAELGDAGRRTEVGRALRLALVLGRLHARGVVHRDVKPSNVLLRPDGRVVLADFGLARLLDRDSSLTGSLIGTPSYMAPELAVDARRSGPAADCWSLAMMLVERLTGSAPFDGMDTTEVVAALQAGRPPFEPETWRSLPDALAPTLGAALEPDPERRLPLASLVEDLRAFLDGRPLRHGSRSASSRLRAALRRRRRPALWILALLLVLVGGRLVRDRLIRHDDPDQALAQGISLLFDTGDLDSVLEPRFEEEEGYSQIAAVFLRPVRSSWERDRLKRASEDLDEARVLADSRELGPDLALAYSVLTARLDGPTVGKSYLGEDLASRALRAELELQIHLGQRDPAARTRDLAARPLPDPDLDLAGLPDAALLEPRDAFFLGLRALAELERAGPWSVRTELGTEPEATRRCRDLLARAASADSPWRGWAHLLQVVLARLEGALERDNDLVRGLADELPGSFWAVYLHAAYRTRIEQDPNESVRVWTALVAAHPQSVAAREVLLSLIASSSQAAFQRGLAQYRSDTSRPALILPLAWSALIDDLGTTAERAEVRALVRAWIEAHPSSRFLPLYLAIHATFGRGGGSGIAQGPDPDQAPVPGIAKARQALDAVERPSAAPVLGGSVETTIAVIDQATGFDQVADWFDADVQEVSLYSWLRVRFAARAGLLGPLLDASISPSLGKRKDMSLCYAIHQLAWIGPWLETSPDAEERLLLRALQLAHSLGPIQLLRGTDMEPIEAWLGEPLVPRSTASDALPRLQSLLGELESGSAEPPSDPRARSTRSAAAYALAHTASLLRRDAELRRACTLLQSSHLLTSSDKAQLLVRMR